MNDLRFQCALSIKLKPFAHKGEGFSFIFSEQKIEQLIQRRPLSWTVVIKFFLLIKIESNLLEIVSVFVSSEFVLCLRNYCGIYF